MLEKWPQEDPETSNKSPCNVHGRYRTYPVGEICRVPTLIKTGALKKPAEVISMQPPDSAKVVVKLGYLEH
jgi:hypothetical protein